MKPPILVPVNRLAAAKGRLSDLLTQHQRGELALATLETVLDAAAAWGTHAFVLTADERVADLVGAPHVLEPEIPGLPGLNPQLEAALQRLQLDEVLILHADLPLATAAALQSVLDAAPARPSATLVESRDGGTNAMLLRPPGSFGLRYGRDSAAAHRAAAQEAGFTVADVASDELALDLDTPDDIELLLASEKGRSSAAGRLLSSWGF